MKTHDGRQGPEEESVYDAAMAWRRLNGTPALSNGKIVIAKTPKGESPLVQGAKPILGCDVWEHSYYIDYRNRRPDYLKAFVDHLVNWDYVAEMYEATSK